MMHIPDSCPRARGDQLTDRNEERQRRGVREGRERSTHILFELDCLVHLPRESINQKQSLPISPPILITLAALLHRLPHRSFQQLHCHLHGDDLALTNACAYERAVRGAVTVLFSAEKVAGCKWVSGEEFRRRKEKKRDGKQKSALLTRKMTEPEVIHQLRALRSLPYTFMLVTVRPYYQ
jgi:hypothetical protein